MDNNKFSVAVSIYEKDNPDYVDISLNSITIEQSLKPTEIVLVMDGPVSDELEKVIEKHENAYPGFKVIRLKKNQGLGNALKLAVENASCDIVARMDSDDISSPDRFKKQMEFLNQNPNVDIVGGNITEFIGDPENIVGKRTVPISDTQIKEYMKIRCPLNHVSVMFRKSSVLKSGNYLDWFCNEDYYLWIRMYLAGMKFANISEDFVNVRVGKDMYNRRGGIKYFKSEARIQKYMLDNKIIGFGTYFLNVSKRFVVQVLMPNKIRGWVFKKFAREKM